MWADLFYKDKSTEIYCKGGVNKEKSDSFVADTLALLRVADGDGV